MLSNSGSIGMAAKDRPWRSQYLGMNPLGFGARNNSAGAAPGVVMASLAPVQHSGRDFQGTAGHLIRKTG